MSDLSDIADNGRAIGRLEGRQAGLEDRLDHIDKQLDNMEIKMDNLSIAIATLSAHQATHRMSLPGGNLTVFGLGAVAASAMAYAKSKFPWLATLLSL